jgi:Flp pilus assembly protein TadG
VIARLRWHGAAEDGAVTTEVAVYVPAAVLLAGLVWAFGATVNASSAVHSAATNAARQASIARTAGQAQRDATTVAHQILDEHHLRCHAITVTVDTHGFTVAVGQPAEVSVDVTCQISLADLYVPGLAGDKSIHEREVSPLDTFRARR